MYKNSASFKKIVIEQLFYLMLLCLIFKVSGLIWGFTIYFIFWHSIPSLNDQIRFLYGNYSFINFKKYFKSAFLYWIISLVGISLLYLISKDMIIFDALFFKFFHFCSGWNYGYWLEVSVTWFCGSELMFPSTKVWSLIQLQVFDEGSQQILHLLLHLIWY